MPRLVNATPTYRLHKGSNQAVVTIDGREHYLGIFNSVESRNLYDRLVAQWLANGRTLANRAFDTFVMELVRDFLIHADKYYRRANGTQTTEPRNMRAAVVPLLELHGETLACEFGPLALDAVRDNMIKRGWCRTRINRDIKRIQLIFRWGVSKEVVPASVAQALATVHGLRAGRSDAKESESVKPALEHRVFAVLPYLSRHVAAMVQLQWWSGARPTEICELRGRDIDMSGKVWVYSPPSHKTAHHKHDRFIFFGPHAQHALRPFLRANMDEYLFSPKEAEEERRAQATATRKTPLSCGNRVGSNRKRRRRAFGELYTVDVYRRAIARACAEAFPMPAEYQDPRVSADELVKMTDQQRAAHEKKRAERRQLRCQWRGQNNWHPHQLRHSAATRIRREEGLEVTKIVLGHKSIAMTELYAERDIEAAKAAMVNAG